jgi:dipeptidyl aminopeptidase/acylaminoacyl peptidase
LALLGLTGALAQTGIRYQKPPQAIEDALNAPPTPNVSLSPQRDYMLLTESPRYPSIADLAQPMLRLAGARVNPNTNGPHQSQRIYKMTLKAVNGGAERVINLPAGAKVSSPRWSADGKAIAFLNTLADGIELWVCDVATAKTRLIKGLRVNDTFGAAFQWLPDQQTLLAQAIHDKRGPAPVASAAPEGPNAQESAGRPGPVRTYQDLLKTPYDEQLFDYYGASQLVAVDNKQNRRAFNLWRRQSRARRPAYSRFADSPPVFVSLHLWRLPQSRRSLGQRGQNGLQTNRPTSVRQRAD